MVSGRQYRELMDEAARWARTARTEGERQTFLQIARTWHDAAIRWEESHGRIAASEDRVARALK